MMTSTPDEEEAPTTTRPSLGASQFEYARPSLRSLSEEEDWSFMDRIFHDRLPQLLFKVHFGCITTGILMVILSVIVIGVSFRPATAAPQFYTYDHNLGAVYTVRDRYLPATEPIPASSSSASWISVGSDDDETEQAAMACPSPGGLVCGGHGVCGGDGLCTCLDGYFGSDCVLASVDAPSAPPSPNPTKKGGKGW